MSAARKPPTLTRKSNVWIRRGITVAVVLALAGGAAYAVPAARCAGRDRCLSHGGGRTRRHPRRHFLHRHAQRDLHRHRRQPDFRPGHRRAGRLQRPGEAGPGDRPHRSQDLRGADRPGQRADRQRPRLVGAGAGDAVQRRSSITGARPTSARASWSRAATSIWPGRARPGARAGQRRAGVDPPAERRHRDHPGQSRPHRDPFAGRTAWCSRAASSRARPWPPACSRRNCSRSPRTWRKMKIELAVDEADIGQVKPGQDVSLQCRCFPRPPVPRQGRAGAAVGDDHQ